METTAMSMKHDTNDIFEYERFKAMTKREFKIKKRAKNCLLDTMDLDKKTKKNYYQIKSNRIRMALLT